jgi:CheY-like chemotaxis protein
MNAHRRRVSISAMSSDPAPQPELNGVPELGDASDVPAVSILEDEPALAALAVDLCRGLGASAAVYASPAPFLEAARKAPPRVLVLDWRLQGQLGAAAFMAFRHSYPGLPVVCWTASQAWHLPQMIRQDPMTRIVDKAAGAVAFEAALRWALALDGPVPDGPGEVRPLPNPA